MRQTLYLLLAFYCIAFVPVDFRWSKIGPGQLGAQEIGFLEDFVLATDREKVLKQLVPGTEAYYYFHSLHFQNNQQLDKVDEFLKPWIKRFGETDRVKLIKHRQALLKYSDDPEATLSYLTDELNLHFNHQREIPQTQRELPTKLDLKLISTEQLISKALARYKNTKGISNKGLRLLANRKLTSTQRRHLLGRLQYPDYPNLVELIVADLKERDSRGFGSLKIHGALTLQQLDQLATKYPKATTSKKYVNTYLLKLHPSEDINWQADRMEHRKYLERLWTFAEKLNPNFNSLKACILFRQLELDQDEGKYNRQLFMEYLKLPRNVGYINPVIIKNVASRKHIVDLNANYTTQIQLLPVINDEPLIKHYLHHFLLNANDTKDFVPYVRDPYLNRQFAITKVLNGIGDTEKWASMLSPEEYKRVLDQVDVEFLPTNPEFFQNDDDVELELYLKNVDTLIVKVFEINTQNYYRKHKREIDTDINLDGLVPNFEETFTYEEPPALRKKQQFKFPQIKQRGVYVVDFIAGGKSSRALIRKGRLQISDQVTAAGQLFSVIDQDGAVVDDANLWIAGSRYEATKDGKILVPFSTQPGQVNAIISQGDFSCLQTISHVAENYQFKSALVLDRENLTRSNKARVLIRPSLQIIGGNPVPVSLLKDPKLTVTSVNLDGISTTKVIDDLVLSEKTETVCEFVVPPRLRTISLSLTARLKNHSRNQMQNVSANQSYTVNLIDQSDLIQDIHLIPSDRGYFLELLGKSGEIRPKQAVRVVIEMQEFANQVGVDLQSDEKGLIALGNLDNVSSIVATPAGGNPKTWQINTQDQNYYQTIHASQGTPIEIPAPAGIVDNSRESIALLEVRRGTFVADLYESVKVKEGLIMISDLKPGDYALRLTYKSQTGSSYLRDITIRVTAGKKVNNVLVGEHRHLESRGSKALHVSRISTNDTKIRIQLENADEFTRLHVIGNRYQPAFNAYRAFAQVRDLEPWVRSPSIRRSVYMEGRKIGDEYEYILRRKYATKYPGNMLERPSLLLNPWEVQETSNSSQDAADGTDYGRVGNQRDGKSQREGEKQDGIGGNKDFANLDYLGDGAVLLDNLKPSKNGIVTIDRAKLGASQHIRVVALNAFNTIQRNINLPLMKLSPQDARLADSLDPDKHFSQSKQIEIMKDGDSLVIDDIVSAKFQQYDDLGDIYQLFLTLNGGTHLAKFEFILTWEDKSQKEKQELYSKFACHELNFFLMNKDPDFFKKVVVPHVKNKRDKTFMDLWLSKENLDQYASPWHYARLNTVERILLSQRLEDRADDIIRNINESYLIAPTSRGQFDTLYDTTIEGFGFDSGLDGRKRELRFSLSDLPQLAKNNMRGSGRGSTTRESSDRSGSFVGESADEPQMFAGRLTRDEMMKNKKSKKYGLSENELSENESINGNRPMVQYKSRPDSLRLGRIVGDGIFDSKAGETTLGQAGQTLNRGGRMRSRMVPVTKYRTETRSRKLPDGSVESYTVQVPYTENVVKKYLEPSSDSDGEEDSESVEAYSYFVAGDLLDRAKSLYRRLSPTKEWMENNYYLLRPKQQTSELVQINRFWRDFSNHIGGDFLSPYFSESHRTFTEMMFALSVLDLPLKGPEHKYDYVDHSMTMTAAGPAIALHQQVRDAIFDRGNTTILVSENFFQKNDRYRHEDGVRFDKFVSGDFLAHTLYGSQVVITNPTSTPRAVELLIQIPLGSVACSGAQETRTIQLDLAAFSTKTFEYAFYFPTAGDFKHYPAHVSADEKVLAVADNQAFKVVDRPAEVDKSSWEFVSQNGTDDEVIEFINQKNILRIDLNKIAFRMKDAKFFERAIKALRNRYVYNHVLWAYAVKHNQLNAIQEYLSHANQFVANCGRYFESELLTIDPVERNWYAHKEYWPLVNDRAHQLGPQRKILNPNFFGQYQGLLSVLANRRQLTDDDHLLITYYMLLQDRIETALDHFSQVSRDALPSQIQYDYCDAYLDMYRENPNEAAAKAEKWADYPVDHWRNRFKHILAQVEEIRGGETETVDGEDNTQKQTELAAKSESFDFEIESGVAKLKYQNLDEVDVNFYEMDIELLFSRSPFAQDDLDGFSMIRPNLTKSVTLETDDKGKGTHEFKLPSEMQNKNVLVEVAAGDQTKSQPYFAHSLNVQLMEKYGQVQVTDEKSDKAIPKTYVKVYARLHDGSVRFHKDGYTDLRGRFDYVSQSNRSIDGIQKFSILILSDDNGAVMRQSNPPKE